MDTPGAALGGGARGAADGVGSVSAPRARQEVEREVMGQLHYQLSRLTQEERNRALTWAAERLAADERLAQSIRDQAAKQTPDDPWGTGAPARSRSTRDEEGAR